MCNYDELMLEMVIDEECDYMYVEYVKDLWMKVNVGICCWFVLLFDNDCN